MKYYISEDNTKLILCYDIKNVYYLKNTIAANNIISEDEFNSYNCTKINKTKFNELINIYFRDIKHEWIYNNNRYRKLENFKSANYNCCVNYDFNKLLHDKDDSVFRYIIVYNHGRAYKANIYYLPKVQLIDIGADKYIKWTDIKHCSPILNVDTNEMM